MNANTHNQAVLERLKKKVQQLVLPNIQDQMRVKCLNILDHVRRMRDYMDFTGNARAGHQFVEYDFPNDKASTWYQDQITPRRGKISLGERAYLRNPVEGPSRTVKGTVDLINDGDTADDTMKSIIADVPGNPNGGLVYRMAVAVEYQDTEHLGYPLDRMREHASKIRIKGKKQ